MSLKSVQILKNLFVLVVLCLYSSLAKGQFTTEVKIQRTGSNSSLTLNPGTGTNSMIQFLRSGVKHAGIVYNGSTFVFKGLSTANDFDPNLALNSTETVNTSFLGNVGINTLTTPTSPLDVYVNTPAQGTYAGQRWTSMNAGFNLRLESIWSTHGINYNFVQKWSNTDYLSLSFFKGNVGIGSAFPDTKLTVKGIIHAEEVKVDLSVPGPDYVFDNSYTLLPLNELDRYIQTNKHLPEVPSAVEMEKNGVVLGEMNMLLLKKIEELTLHLIEQNKMLNAQGELLRLQQEKITTFERTVDSRNK